MLTVPREIVYHEEESISLQQGQELKQPSQNQQKHQEEEAKIEPASEDVSDQRIPNFVAQPVQNYELCATKSPKTCRAAKLLKRLYVHQTNVSDFELLALEFSVIIASMLLEICTTN